MEKNNQLSKKINWKTASVILSAVLLIFLAITQFYPVKAQQAQTQCPESKSFPAKGDGLGISPISAHFPLTGLMPQVVNTPEGAQQKAQAESASECTTKLTDDLARATKECFKYCASVKGCQAQVTVNGPNSCDGNQAACEKKEVTGASLPARILHLLEQLIPIPLSNLISSQV